MLRVERTNEVNCPFLLVPTDFEQFSDQVASCSLLQDVQYWDLSSETSSCFLFALLWGELRFLTTSDGPKSVATPYLNTPSNDCHLWVLATFIQYRAYLDLRSLLSTTVISQSLGQSFHILSALR